jgi:hypothetical protein
MEETGLAITVNAGEFLKIAASGISSMKHALCSLTLEAT